MHSQTTEFAAAGQDAISVVIFRVTLQTGRKLRTEQSYRLLRFLRQVPLYSLQMLLPSKYVSTSD